MTGPVTAAVCDGGHCPPPARQTHTDVLENRRRRDQQKAARATTTAQRFSSTTFMHTNKIGNPRRFARANTPPTAADHKANPAALSTASPVRPHLTSPLLARGGRRANTPVNCQVVSGTFDTPSAAVQDVRVNHSRLHITVPEEFLDRADIVAGAQQISGKRMA